MDLQPEPHAFLRSSHFSLGVCAPLLMEVGPSGGQSNSVYKSQYSWILLSARATLRGTDSIDTLRVGYVEGPFSVR